MGNYSQTTKQDIENIKDKDFSGYVSNENRELFRRALSEAMDSKIGKIEQEIKDMEIPPISKRHKIGMNRLFRENVGGHFLPFPEADNLYERTRSKIIVKLKINEFLDKCEERRRRR